VSRGLAFWDDDTIKLIRENFVAASVPTWVCRTESPEGEFLRAAGIHKQWVTSSGYMSCLSASGKPLGRRPCEEVLAEFQKLPKAERAPRAVRVPSIAPSQIVIPSPPNGGLVLQVHARFLEHGDSGELRHAMTADFPLMRDNPKVMRTWKMFLQPNTEYMWLTAGEWRSLVPTDPIKGQRIKVGSNIAERMARFHLTPQRATTSEGHIVRSKQVKTARLELVVDAVSRERIQMSLQGFVHWGSDYDEAQATTPNGPLAQGFETPLYGRLEYDRPQNAFARFDIIAVGHVWGRWGDANNKSMYVERPGRAPFGFAFELATGKSPSHRIPPGGNGRYVTDRTGYFPKSDN
jgi:hypothetical protein